MNQLKVMFAEGGEGRVRIGRGKSLFSNSDAIEKSMIDAITNLKKKYIYLTGNKICDMNMESSNGQPYDGTMETRFESEGHHKDEEEEAESGSEDKSGRDQCSTYF